MPPEDIWNVKVIPAYPGWMSLGSDFGVAAKQNIYTSYYTDRQSRFYYRGLARQGICFWDPAVVVVDTDAGCDPDNC